jgi:hypothetical protein
MTVSEYDSYISTIDVIEDRISNYDKFPVIQDNKLKNCCQFTLEVAKMMINYFKVKIDATQEKKKY